MCICIFKNCMFKYFWWIFIFFWAIGLFLVCFFNGEGSGQLKSIRSGMAMMESGSREVKWVSKLLNSFPDEWTMLMGHMQVLPSMAAH